MIREEFRKNLLSNVRNSSDSVRVEHGDGEKKKEISFDEWK